VLLLVLLWDVQELNIVQVLLAMFAVWIPDQLGIPPQCRWREERHRQLPHLFRSANKPIRVVPAIVQQQEDFNVVLTEFVGRGVVPQQHAVTILLQITRNVLMPQFRDLVVLCQRQP